MDQLLQVSGSNLSIFHNSTTYSRVKTSLRTCVPTQYPAEDGRNVTTETSQNIATTQLASNHQSAIQPSSGKLSFLYCASPSFLDSVYSRVPFPES